MSWFDVKQITPTVWAIMEPGHYEEAISYLVIGQARAILVDTGMAIGNLTAEAERITSLPLSVVNTHAHWDHRGENYKFTDIAIHALEAPLLEQEHGPEKLHVKTTGGQFTRATPPDWSAQAWTVRPSRATRLLHDGDSIDLGDRALSVLHTPGHSPGHICLLDRTERWLMSGDVYYPGNLYLHFASASVGDMLSTARRLAALQPELDLVLPSHNQTPMPPAELGRLATAMQAVADGVAAWEPRQSEWGVVKRYPFGSFAVWTR